MMGIIMVVALAFGMTAPAYAGTIDLWQPSMPGTEKVYGAGTCRQGFPASCYLPCPPNGFGNDLHVSTKYVIRDRKLRGSFGHEY